MYEWLPKNPDETEKTVLDRLDDLEAIDRLAKQAASAVHNVGYSCVELCPGDATVYVIAMVTGPRGSLYMGSTFGSMYMTNGPTDWSYVFEKWVNGNNHWTAVVLSLWLRAFWHYRKEDL